MLRLAKRFRRSWQRAFCVDGGSSTLRGIDYWEWRARTHGERAVMHLARRGGEIEAVTRMQTERILPVLRARLRGDERFALDFGCGSGRFTALLASAIGGRALGVDPVAALLELAPRTAAVDFRQMRDGRIPLPEASTDVVFVCLVLGGITDPNELAAATRELARVLRPQGLLLLIENTTQRSDLPHWRYRSAAGYSALFPDVALAPVDHYFDLGERVEILAGRRVGEAGR